MKTPIRLAAFAGALLVVFAGAAGIGNTIGPFGTGDSESESEAMAGHELHETAMAAPSDTPAGAAPAVKGLSVSQDGYTLDLSTTIVPVGQATAFAFEVTGPDGAAVTDFTPTHDKDLHLIVVRRDTTGFQHLHPERDRLGRWTVPLTLPAAGAYKVFADFAPGDRDDALTLTADISAAGTYDPQPLAAPSRTAQVDGYTVTLQGDLVAGRDSPLSLNVARDGQPVTDLQPYLAAYGHLVALRAADLAYLHVHPEGEPGDGRTAAGPDIPFVVEVPTSGTYRLYLDFQHDGVVRTAEFTAEAGATAADAAAPTSPTTPAVEEPAAEEHGEGH